MVRKSSIGTSNGGKSPAKKSRNSDDSSDTSASTTEINTASVFEVPRASVHKQNLYIVSFPIIFLFNILRSLLYQFFVVFKYIFSASTRFVYRPARRKECTLEVIVSANVDGELPLINGDEIVQMATPKAGPGPGDPLLAKQKHHHRRAFEYISKALKIDEENEGIFTRILYNCYYCD